MNYSRGFFRIWMLIAMLCGLDTILVEWPGDAIQSICKNWKQDNKFKKIQHEYKKEDEYKNLRCQLMRNPNNEENILEGALVLGISKKELSDSEEVKIEECLTLSHYYSKFDARSKKELLKLIVDRINKRNDMAMKQIQSFLWSFMGYPALLLFLGYFIKWIYYGFRTHKK